MEITAPQSLINQLRAKLKEKNITTVDEVVDFLKQKLKTDNLTDFLNENQITYEELTNFFKKLI